MQLSEDADEEESQAALAHNPTGERVQETSISYLTKDQKTSNNKFNSALTRKTTQSQQHPQATAEKSDCRQERPVKSQLD